MFFFGSCCLKYLNEFIIGERSSFFRSSKWQYFYNYHLIKKYHFDTILRKTFNLNFCHYFKRKPAFNTKKKTKPKTNAKPYANALFRALIIV